MVNRKLKTVLLFALVGALALGGWSCKKDEDNTTSPTGNTGGTDDISIYKKIYGASEVYQDGDYVVIKVNGRPDHKSPYYQGTQCST